MKKLFLGIAIGLILALPIGAHAEGIVNMIGKTIDGQFDVTLNGKKLDNPAIVIEGTSYLPVRAIGDALNLDVSFDANLGINLKSKDNTSVQSGAIKIDPKNDPAFVRAQKIADLQKQQRDLISQMDPISDIIIKHDHDKLVDRSTPDTEEYLQAKQKLDELRKQYQDIDAQIADLQKQQQDYYKQQQAQQ